MDAGNRGPASVRARDPDGVPTVGPPGDSRAPDACFWMGTVFGGVLGWIF